MLLMPALGEDWAKIAAETDEPAFGMRIEFVSPDSPAGRIGLKSGDFIYQIGERAMRGFVDRNRNQEETLFFCKGGRKGTAQLEPGKIGVNYVEEFRPQLAYLRGEIGGAGPRWDAAAVEALALLAGKPAESLKRWEEAKALGYPDDELDAFVRAFAAWRTGRPFYVRRAYEAVDAEFKTMPRLYAAFLEDMAYASGQIDLLRTLRLADPDSSKVPEALLKTWETLRAEPLPERRLLDLAKQRRDRDLLPEIGVLDADQPAGAEDRLERLKIRKGLGANPGRIQTTRLRLPDEVKDFHLVLSFHLFVWEFHETSTSRARLGVYGGTTGKRLDRPVLAELTVVADRFIGTRISARGGHDWTLRHQRRLDKHIPVKGREKEGEAPRMSGPFRVELVRLGGEAAVYCDGVPYCHLPIDATVDNYEVQWLLGGISAMPAAFEAWSLKDE